MRRPEGPDVAVDEERIVVLVRGAHEGAITESMLRQARVPVFLCQSVGEVHAAVRRGAAAAMIAEEILSPAVLRELGALVDEQPPWSDFPFLVFTAGQGGTTGRVEAAFARLGNVTLLDRPVHVRTMLAAVRAAVRARRRQYQARAAIESRDAFLAMLGHELRNPLGAITLAIGAFMRAYPDLKAKEPVIVERQARHLARLVDDLLDVARVERGKIALTMDRVDLVEVLGSAHQAFSLLATEQQLAYELDVPKGPLWVRGDPYRLQQVFSNLLTNAAKYTPKGGRVRVELVVTGAWVEVKVSDTGIGIEPEMRSRVFDVFTQADRSLDRAQGGLGLGLSIVRSVVQLHGGTVAAESAGLGHGATFVVRLPAAARESEAPPPSRVSCDAALGRRSIVVVEDSADNRELMVDILAGAGHAVVSAADGPDGLARILASSPDVAFVDIGLPGFDGFELARRARRAGSTTRLIALTGYGQPEDRRQSALAGFDAHITKPISHDELQRAVRGTSLRPDEAGGRASVPSAG